MNQSQNNLVNVFEPNGIKWILNEAFSISIARFKLFVTLVAIIQVPAIILSLYFSGLTEQENRYDLILQIISYLTAFFAMTVTWWRIISISLWAVLLTIPLFAITYLANNAFNNQENTLYMLSIIIVMVTFIPFLIYTSFYTQTVIIEGFNLLNGIKRSANLIHQKILKVFAAIILIGLLAIGLSVIVNIPFALLELSEFENNVNIGNPNSSILFYSILFLRNFVDSVIVFPILITAGTLLYFDIRSDKENYDINKLFDDIHISSHNLKLQQ